MRFLKVKNFGKYQHYTDRNPPWIKLYRSLLNDYDFHQLTIPSRLLYVCCLILASESDNRIPHDYQFLSGRCAMEVNELVLTPLIDSGLLLASGARRTLASCKHFATSSSLLSSSSLSTPISDQIPDLKSTKQSKTKGNGRADRITMPDDWAPNDSHAKLALARHLDLPIEAAHFRGKALELEWVTKNWDQKFTNWMLQEIKFRTRRAT